MRDKRWNEPKLASFHGFLYFMNNGKMDVEGFIDSKYGKELLNRLEIRSKIEDNQEEAIKYYDSLGLIKEFNDYDDYYKRWSCLIPKNYDGLLPVVFWLHGRGNSIEAEELMHGFHKIAGKEKFILASPQDTNASKVLEIIDDLDKRYPLDHSRIYLAGFSQGAAQTHGIYMRYPKLFAGALTCGDEPFRPWDNFNKKYTKSELSNCKKYKMPLIQFSGQAEPFPFAPLNTYFPHKRLNGKPWGSPDSFTSVGKSRDLDPTLIHKKISENGIVKEIIIMDKSYKPKKGEDPSIWSLNRLNTRLDLLNCQKRDIKTCLSYKDLHQDEFHYVVGAYGDLETIKYYYDYRHYILGINDNNGNEMYRFIVINNFPHWIGLETGKLGWDFFKRFQRNNKTGELIIKTRR